MAKVIPLRKAQPSGYLTPESDGAESADYPRTVPTPLHPLRRSSIYRSRHYWPQREPRDWGGVIIAATLFAVFLALFAIGRWQIAAAGV